MCHFISCSAQPSHARLAAKLMIVAITPHHHCLYVCRSVCCIEMLLSWLFLFSSNSKDWIVETVEAVGGTAVGCLVPSRLISFKLRGGHLTSPCLTSPHSSSYVRYFSTRNSTVQRKENLCLFICLCHSTLSHFAPILQAQATPLELPYISLSFVKTETI